MIVQELIDENTVCTYSDKGFYIYGGFPVGNYAKAIDPIDQRRKYTETKIPIKTVEEIEEPVEKDYHLFMEQDRLKVERALKKEHDNIIETIE